MDNETQVEPAAEQPATAPPAASRPGRQRLLNWALLVALPVCGWLGWMAAMSSGGMQDYQRLRDERAAIHAEVEESRLRQQQLEVDLLVARQAAADNQAVVDDLEQQLFRLQQDLAQYQGALVPNAMTHGVRIQAFELQATDVPGVFRYKIMVSRVGNESDTVAADLLLNLKGTLEGQPAEYSLAELTVGQTESLALNFRYFQVVPGTEDAELMLPLGFEPQQIQLRVEHEGKVLLEQTLEWTETGARS